MKIHKNIQQGTEEWLELRRGKMTGSHGQEIGNCGKGLDTYIYKIVAEELSSGEYEQYTNHHMERGNELEGLARTMYEMETGQVVEEVGFVELSEFVGVSPDGLVGENGGIEIKSHDDVKHLKIMVNGLKEIESKYIWQIQMNMLVTGREWWDYVAYNPNFKKSLLIFRFEADEEKHKKLLAGFELGEAKIKSIKSKL